MSDQQPDSPGVGPSMGGSGACPEVKHNNRVWLVGHPTQKAKTELELAVAALAIANLDEMQPVLSAAKFKDKCDALDLRIEGGHHRTWGTLWSSACSGPFGTALFLMSLLREKQPATTFLEARTMLLEEPRQVKLAFAQVVPSFFTLLAESLAIPAEQRAALVTVSTAELMAGLDGTPQAPVIVTG